MKQNYISKYPKFSLLFLTFLIAYFIFYERNYAPFHDLIISMGYIGTFIGGMFLTYGFTAAPATSILLILAKEQNILIAGFIGGFGALIGDIIIFTFIRHHFAKEIKRLSRERMVRYFSSKVPLVLKKYLLLIIAGFIIASPLPDEIAVSLLATSKTISIRIFSIISYTLNTAGIFAILYIGKVI